MSYYDGDVAGKAFAVWGLAFKPNTDDMREAPSRVVIQALLRAGARVTAHDPIAAAEAQRVIALDLSDAPHLRDRIDFAQKPMEAVEGADALIVITEWKAYRSPSLSRLKSSMRSPVVFDGRNLYDPIAMRMEGFSYFGVGRSA
jgi:UDPglucose 6-dehydrogenase